MHDIDRTQKEFEMALREIQPEQFEYGRANGFGEYEGEGAYEAWHEAGMHEFPAQEAWQETGSYEGEMYEGAMYEGEMYESGLNEAEEMELASELLEVTNEAELDQFIGNLIGRSLKEALASPERQPAQLAAYYRAWRASPTLMRAAPPTLAFAAVGQAKFDGRITPEEESRTLADLLTYWAARSALDTSTVCATQPRPRALKRAPRPQTKYSFTA